MEERKQKEIEYYDKQAENFKSYDFRPKVLNSFRFIYRILKSECKDKKVLDYGCGKGYHSVRIAKMGGKVTGIDLSFGSLQIARKLAAKEGVEETTSFLQMDCEDLKFEDSTFDIVFDGGTFSSLDLDKAMPQIRKVLKKDGKVIAIETFGHNPLGNLKRKFNRLKEKRTEWAEEHILKTKDIESFKDYFGKVEVKYFHLLSLFFIPLLKIPLIQIPLIVFEAIDSLLFKIPLFKKYAFKVVIILSDPKKYA